MPTGGVASDLAWVGGCCGALSAWPGPGHPPRPRSSATTFRGDEDLNVVAGLSNSAALIWASVWASARGSHCCFDHLEEGRVAAAKMSAGVSGRRGRRAAGTVDRPHIRPARDRLVRFRYSAVEYGAVSDAARRAGYTVSGYIAETALAAAGRRDDVRPASGLDRELLVALNAAREQVAGSAPTSTRPSPGSTPPERSPSRVQAAPVSATAVSDHFSSISSSVSRVAVDVSGVDYVDLRM